MSETPRKRLNAVLIAGGKYHDIDFARLEILKLLAQDDRVRVRVFEDYSNLEALRAWLEAGGKWYALHGTNSILRFLANGQVDSPRWAPHFMETLGSMFIAHPPIVPYTVTVADPDHPLVQGIQPFQADDELYLSETYGELHVLLDTEFEGEATGFVEHTWPKARHPVFYLHPVGKGEVLYLTLGHCRGHYDMQPMMEFYPVPEKGSWALPVFYELLGRGLEWVKTPAGAAAS